MIYEEGGDMIRYAIKYREKYLTENDRDKFGVGPLDEAYLFWTKEGAKRDMKLAEKDESLKEHGKGKVTTIEIKDVGE